MRLSATHRVGRSGAMLSISSRRRRSQTSVMTCGINAAPSTDHTQGGGALTEPLYARVFRRIPSIPG
jgi:hypothetical protein